PFRPNRDSSRARRDGRPAGRGARRSVARASICPIRSDRGSECAWGRAWIRRSTRDGHRIKMPFDWKAGCLATLVVDDSVPSGHGFLVEKVIPLTGLKGDISAFIVYERVQGQ